jgi:hypothetical protein
MPSTKPEIQIVTNADALYQAAAAAFMREVRVAASLFQTGQIRMPTSGGEAHPPRLHPIEGEVKP